MKRFWPCEAGKLAGGPARGKEVDAMDRPKLRHGLELLPVLHEGRRYFMLRDRLGYSEEPLIVSPAAAQLLACMDGEHTLRDIQSRHLRATGEILYTEQLEEMVARLESGLFLENERFVERVAREAGRFRDDPVRRMQFAGKSYPADPSDLASMLGGFFDVAKGGPGLPETGRDPRRLLALVAPHIDLQAGGPTFAHAYRASAEARSPRTWVVMGTGHEPLENFFALTEKDFETPLGTVPCDRRWSGQFLRQASLDVAADEYHHRREHTIEFQAVFLALAHPGARLVPLLCSFSLEDLESRREAIDGTADLMARLAFSGDDPAGLLASVDLAHIGPRYGDSFSPDGADIARHRASDLELLEALKSCDPEGFVGILRRENNGRRVCGLAPLYMLARILRGRARGELLHHDHAVVDGRGSFVTFAAMAFYEI